MNASCVWDNIAPFAVAFHGLAVLWYPAELQGDPKTCAGAAQSGGAQPLSLHPGPLGSCPHGEVTPACPRGVLSTGVFTVR